MIIHKTDITKEQLLHVHPRLLEILEVSAFLAWAWYRDDLRITAIHDPFHPGTTHRALEKKHRFVDASLLKNGGVVGSERLRATINAAYEYDPSRVPNIFTVPPLNHEGTLKGSTACHFHFQIPPKWLSVVSGETA